MLLEGLFLPLTTPFYPDGRCNLRKLEHNVRLYSKTPAAGLMLLSEHGEPSMLTDDERRQVMGAAIDAAEPEKVMLVGVSHDSVAETVRRSEYAARLGYDAVLVDAPSVLRDGSRAKELLAYFVTVADRSPLPVVLVSSASARTGLLDLGLVIELARHQNIDGLVDAADGSERIAAIKAGTTAVKRDVTVTTVFAAVTGRMKAQDETRGGSFVSAAALTDGATALAVAPPSSALKTRIKSVGFQMMAGSAAGMLEGLRAGATGVAPAFAACAPQACYEVVAAWKDGDEGLADEKQARILEAAAYVETQLGVPGIKFGCDLNGYYGGVARSPLLPTTGAERSEVERLMLGTRS